MDWGYLVAGRFLCARVSEWFKEKTCKVFIRKFESCPVLQFLYYNRLVKIKKVISLYKCFSLSKAPSSLGAFWWLPYGHIVK